MLNGNVGRLWRVAAWRIEGTVGSKSHYSLSHQQYLLLKLSSELIIVRSIIVVVNVYSCRFRPQVESLCAKIPSMLDAVEWRHINSCRMLFDQTGKSFESMGIVMVVFTYTIVKFVASS